MSVTKSEQITVPSREAQIRDLERQKMSRYLVRGVSNGLFTALAVVIGLLWSVPTFGLFVSSFRPGTDINTSGWWSGLVPPWAFTLQNYADVIHAQGFGQAFLNSIIIAVPGTILPLILGAFAAYAFAWMNFPGRNWIFLGIVALQIIPL